MFLVIVSLVQSESFFFLSCSLITMTMEFKHIIPGFAHCDIVMSFEQVGLELASCFLKFKMLLDSIYSELKYIKKKS